MIGPSDPLGWAKNPKSREAIAAIHDLSRRDRRFTAIWEQLVQEEVATAAGRALKVWDGQRWQSL